MPNRRQRALVGLCCAELLLALFACEGRGNALSLPLQASTAGAQAVVPEGSTGDSLPARCEWLGYGQGSVLKATCQPMHWLSHAALLCRDFGGQLRGAVFADQACSPDGSEVQVQCCFETEPPLPSIAPADRAIAFSLAIVPAAGEEAGRKRVFAEAERRCAGAIADRVARYTDALHQNVSALHFSCRK
jgi:hypothetical protein